MRFDYLSTVSGGGYIGSLLTAWAQRTDYADVVRELSGNPILGARISPLQHLRRYSSYLVPRVGLLSTDTLTLVALYVRNLLLNWLVFIPMLLLGIGIVKLLAVLAWSIPASAESIAVLGTLAIAVSGAAVLDSLQQRPGWGDKASSRKRFLYFEMLPALLGGSFASLAALNFFQMGVTGPSQGDATIIAQLNPIIGVTLIGTGIFLVAAMFALAFSPPRRAGPPSTADTIRTIPWVRAMLVIAAFAATGALTGFALAIMQTSLVVFASCILRGSLSSWYASGRPC